MILFSLGGTVRNRQNAADVSVMDRATEILKIDQCRKAPADSGDENG
jgi:hypothetical protein